MSSKSAILVTLAAGAALAAAVVAAVSVLAPAPPPRVPLPRKRPDPVALPMTPEARKVIDGLLSEARKNRQFDDLPKAIENGETALKFLRDRGRTLEAARFLVEIGEWYMDAGDVHRGAAYLRSAYAQAQDALDAEERREAERTGAPARVPRHGPVRGGPDGPPSWAPWVEVSDKAEAKHRDLAFALSDRKDDRAALSILEEMLKEFRRRGDRGREAQALHNQAWVVSDNGRQEEAVRLYERALAIRAEIGDREGAAWTLNNLSVARRRAGDLAASREAVLAALREAGRDFPAAWATALDNVVLLAQEARKSKAQALAVSVLEAVVPVLRERDELYLYERVWLERALAFRESGDFARAGEVLDELVAWERRARYAYGGALFMHEKARTLALEGRADDAAEVFEIAIGIQTAIGDVLGAAASREALGRALRGAGRKDEALAAFREAAAGFESSGPDRGGLTSVLPELAAALDEAGRTEEAGRARRRLEEVEALPPPEDLPRFVYVEGCEGRESLIAGMKGEDDLVRVVRTADGWKFEDAATGRETAVPFSWRGRHIVFQGMDFRVEGPMLSHRGFRVFLSEGESAAATVGGKFYRRTR